MFAEIFDIALLVGMVVAFVASGITAYAGFGGALIMVPLFTLLLGPVQAIALTGLCGAVALVHLLPKLARIARWSEIVPVFLGVVVTTSIGAEFLISADPDFVRLCMGLFVVGAAIILIFDLRYSGPRGVMPSLGVGLVTGGIMGGVGVPAGPVMVIYYLAAPEAAPVQRANIMVSVWLLLMVMLTNLVMRDAIMGATLASAVFVAPAAILGGVCGQYLFRHIPLAWFQHFAHGLLVVIGASMLLL